jgi:phospholipid-binding lipoprotein MlaA
MSIRVKKMRSNKREKEDNMKKYFFVTILVLCMLVPLSAWSQTPVTGPYGEESLKEKAAEQEAGEAQPSEAETIADPLEPFNRAMFTFNDRLYFWVMKPAATGYNAVVPEAARTSVSNIFHNIETPVRFVNALLQADPKAAGIELVRVIINSSVGIGGIFDVMKQNPSFQPQEKDFGQTLGKYGIGNGLYIVWPFLGPSTARDTVGLVGDIYLDPVNYIKPSWKPLVINTYKTFNATSLRIGEYEDFKEAAIDPYIAVKDAYLEHRKYMLTK